MTQITPVRTAISHVDAEDGYSKGEVVLVKDSFELGVQ